MKKSVTILLRAAVFLPLMGKDLLLMEKGKSNCVIIKSDAKCPVQDFAARELSLFLGKIAKGEKPAIATAAVKGKSVITFQLLKKDKFLKEDGFLKNVMEAIPKRIAGAEDRKSATVLV